MSTEQEEWTRRQTAAFGNLVIMGYTGVQNMVMKDRMRDALMNEFPWPTFASVFIDFYHLMKSLPLATPELSELQLAWLQGRIDAYYDRIHAGVVKGTKTHFDGEWFGVHVSKPFTFRCPLPIIFYGRYANLAEVLMYVIEHGSAALGAPAIALPNVSVEVTPDPLKPDVHKRNPLFLYLSDDQAKDGRFCWRLDLLTKKAVQGRSFVVLHTYD